MGNEQEAKKFRRGLANVKKKFKPKKQVANVLVKNKQLQNDPQKKPSSEVKEENENYEAVSVMESVFQPQNDPQSIQFGGYNSDDDLLVENEKLALENKQIKEDIERKEIEAQKMKVQMKIQTDEIKQLMAQLEKQK